MLRQRMEFLRSSGVIGEDVAASMGKVIDMMSADYPWIPVNPAILFATHLAMALERIKRGEIVAPLDEEIFAEITSCPEYPIAVALRSKLLAFCPVDLPENEGQFLIMHICNMLVR